MKNKILFICFISLLGFNNVYSQEFQFKGNNLFGLEITTKDTTNFAIKSMFYDVDADGDQDAILIGISKRDSVKYLSFENIHYFIDVQENIGDRWHPSFKTRKPFMNNFPYPNGYFFPSIGDLNHDGMPDFIVSSGIDSFRNLQTLYYERKSITGNNQFNIIGADSLELNVFLEGSFFMPDLADMDMDGDLDILLSGYQSGIDTSGKELQEPIFFYAKNIGTITKPKFLGWYPNPYGLANAINETQLSTVGDIDNDNDNDILSLTTVDTFKVITFLQNNHTPNGKPNFDNFSTLLGLPVAGKEESLYPPSLVDIDGDGDLDIFLVQALNSTGVGIGYYENKLCATNFVNVSRSICYGDSVKIGNQVFKSSGEYFVTFEKSNHCDSTVHLSLLVYPAYLQNQQRSICQGEEYTIGGYTFNQTGIYQIKLNSSNGCDSIIDLNLIIHPKFTSSLTKSLCTGEVFTVGNQTFTQNGQYEVKLQTIFGCDSIVNAILTFSTPDVGVTQSQNALTANLSGAKYQWFDCISLTDIDGATGQSYTPTKNGKYSVKLTDGNNCKSVSACYDFVLTGIDIQLISNQITIYPNPTDDYFTIKNSSEYPLSSVIIKNNIGQVIKMVKPNLIEKIGTADLQGGMYNIEITVGQWKVTKNLVVVNSGK
ncbi:MAG: T9SS type A sorting domain-containing protein [Saprospiraceae bacterium]|nr:T9SS type A sorting domain-containing protein [Saprospiraceae bacterium]